MTERQAELELDPFPLLAPLNGGVADLPFCCLPRRRLLRRGRLPVPVVASVEPVFAFVGAAEVEIGEADAVPVVLCRNIMIWRLFLSLSGARIMYLMYYRYGWVTVV